MILGYTNFCHVLSFILHKFYQRLFLIVSLQLLGATKKPPQMQWLSYGVKCDAIRLVENQA